MQIQLRWVDPTTGKEKNPRLEPPVLFGSSMTAMPSSLDGKAASRMVLDHEQVEPFHAVIEVVGGQLYINDRNSLQGTKVNRVARASHKLKAGDRIQIGPFEILVSLPSATNPSPANPSSNNPPPINPPPLPTPATTPPPLPPDSPAPPPLPTANVGVGGFVAPVVSSADSTDSFANGGADGGVISPGMGPDGTCNNKVGFLIKRRCGRTNAEGCKFCRNGQVDPNRELYRDDYNLYPNYGHYGRSYWGSNYYYNRDRYYYDSTHRRVDFTEADGASFEDESEQDYEMDLDAS